MTSSLSSNSKDMKAVKRKLKSSLHSGIGLFFEYETHKVVQISSIKVGFMYRLVQFIILSYIFGWVIIYKKGYQEFDIVVSSVTTKVKGVQFTNLSGTSIGARIWDVADYVIPPQENNAFFIMTNAVVTNDQSQGRCPEDPNVAPCSRDSDCPPGKPQMLGNGVNTGHCVNSAQTPGKKSCEVLAWCPIEIDRLPTNSTIFPNADKKGGVIAVNIRWECNLDWSISSCRPEYKFSSLDNPRAQVAEGWNFRYANFYRSNNGTDYRIMVKAYGIRFIVYVTGQAGKFSIVPLTVNIGSGLALLGLATILCDIIVLYLLNKRSVYREAKFQTLLDDDAYKQPTDDDDSRVGLSSVGGKTTVQGLETTSAGTYGATER